MGKIVVTGANGNLGRGVVETLMKLVDKKDLILTSSRVEKIKDFADMGYDCREADFGDPKQLEEAFAGAESMLLISLPQVGRKRRMMHTNAAIAARNAGVKRLLYTSSCGAGILENAGYENNDHHYTEQLIEALGFDYVFLRNTQYAEAMIAAVETAAKTTGVVRNNMGDGRVAHVSRKDCAEAAASAAAGDYHNEIFYISGDTPRTIAEFIEIVAPAFGKPVTYEFITDEENYAEFDRMGIPRETDGEWLTEEAKNSPYCSKGMVTFGTAIRLDQMSQCTDDFVKLTGHHQITLEEMAANVADFGVGERNATD